MKEENKNIDSTVMEIIQIMKEGFGEKTVVEYFLKMYQDKEEKLTSIGYVKDLNSEFKNEFFDEIYEDENGNIVDLRLRENKPDYEEMIKLNEYWNELHFKFKKDVKPYIVIT